jgi:lipid A 4'-phosphatase
MIDRKNPFGWAGHPVFAAAFLAGWIALALVFHGEPQWDRAVASWFFDENACAAAQRAQGQYCIGFPLSVTDTLGAIREILHPAPVILGIILAIIMVAEIVRGKRWSDGRIRVKAVLIGTLALGPGLLVNGILKAQWGRPRPWMTEDFGGWLPFVAAGTKTDYCASNCSFVSGEAAAAGWLMCIALLLVVWRRWGAATLIATIAIFMAALRVAFGAHYLSDAILGFLSTLLVFAMLAAISEWATRIRAQVPADT